MNTNFSEAIDQLHLDCMTATREIRSDYMKLRRAAAQWDLTECPPLPFRPTRPLSVWLDGESADVPVPVTWDAAKVWDADDPLLTPRHWLRTGGTR